MNMKKYLIFGTIALLSFLPTAAALGVNIKNPDTRGEFFVTFGGRQDFGAIILFIIQNILLPLTGIVAMLFIIFGGFRYITSAGDAEAAESGKRMVSNAVIGIVVIALSYTIIATVVNALKAGGS
jgi:hypothetical protein